MVSIKLKPSLSSNVIDKDNNNINENKRKRITDDKSLLLNNKKSSLSKKNIQKITNDNNNDDENNDNDITNKLNNKIKLNNVLPSESQKTSVINNIILPIIDPKLLDEYKKKTIKISQSSNLQYYLQHGYIMKGNDVKKIDGYIKFKEFVYNDFNNMDIGKNNGKHALRSENRVLSIESNEHFSSKFFNYGNPSLRYDNINMDNNDFFPQDASYFGAGMVQVSQCTNKYWSDDIDKFICYFTKKYVHIYDEYKNLIPYSLCTLRYDNVKKNNRPYHNDPKAYEAIVGFNFEGTATFKLERYNDFKEVNHPEQIYNIDDDDTYIMLGDDTCRKRKHAVDGCSQNRFVPLIKYVDKNEFIQKIKKSPKFNEIKKTKNGIEVDYNVKLKALEKAVEDLTIKIYNAKKNTNINTCKL